MSEKSESTFFLRYAVTAAIAAPPETIWQKLTDAAGFAQWNSTVESLEGTIALGEKLTIRVPVAPGRAFTPKVVELVPAERMVWRDGVYPMFQGTCIFTLARRGATTDFEKVEEFRGLMLPLIKGSLPDFCPVFDRFAADLKAAIDKA
jgi:uncharacterized protein YndB with AHSA1/START domain